MSSDKYTGYAGKQASKKDEADLKQYEAAAATTTKKSDKGLQKALEEKGLSLTVFANADEHYRKRALKEDYEALKLKHGWLYDQPIE